MRIDRKALTCAMLDADVKIVELAREANVSRNTISAIKNGKSASMKTIKKIAKALNISLEELILKDNYSQLINRTKGDGEEHERTGKK